MRLARPRKMREYESFVHGLEAEGMAAMEAAHGATREEGYDAMTTRLMLALRTREGIDTDELAATFGPRLAAHAAAACREAASEMPSEWMADGQWGAAATGGDDPETEGGAPGRFALSDPDGLLFSNEAISTVFARLDERVDKDAAAVAEP